MYHQLKSYVSEYVKLSDEDWEKILPLFKPTTISKNQFLVKEGQTAHSVYFINSGLFRIFYSKDGVETNRYFAAENEFATTLTSFFTQEPSFENMQALEDSQMLQLHIGDLEKIYEQQPLWEKFFRQLLQEAYIGMAKRIESFITKTAEQRYSDFVKMHKDLLQRIPQQYIATLLGVTPVSLSRIRAQNSKH